MSIIRPGNKKKKSLGQQKKERKEEKVDFGEKCEIGKRWGKILDCNDFKIAHYRVKGFVQSVWYHVALFFFSLSLSISMNICILSLRTRARLLLRNSSLFKKGRFSPYENVNTLNIITSKNPLATHRQQQQNAFARKRERKRLKTTHTHRERERAKWCVFMPRAIIYVFLPVRHTCTYLKSVSYIRVEILEIFSLLV